MRAVYASHRSSGGLESNHSRSCLSLHAAAEPLPPRTCPTTGDNAYWRRRTLMSGDLISSTLEAGACHTRTAGPAAEDAEGQLPQLDTWGYCSASTATPTPPLHRATVGFPQPRVLAVARRAEKTQVPQTWRRESQQVARGETWRVEGTQNWQTVQGARQGTAVAGQVPLGEGVPSGTRGNTGSSTTSAPDHPTFEKNRMNDLIGTLRNDVGELRSQGTSLSKQLWLLYITFEDFMHIHHPDRSTKLLNSSLSNDARWTKSTGNLSGYPSSSSEDCTGKKSLPSHNTRPLPRYEQEVKVRLTSGVDSSDHCQKSAENMDKLVSGFTKMSCLGEGGEALPGQHVQSPSSDVYECDVTSPGTTSSGYETDQDYMTWQETRMRQGELFMAALNSARSKKLPMRGITTMSQPEDEYVIRADDLYHENYTSSSDNDSTTYRIGNNLIGLGKPGTPVSSRGLKSTAYLRAQSEKKPLKVQREPTYPPNSSNTRKKSNSERQTPKTRRSSVDKSRLSEVKKTMQTIICDLEQGVETTDAQANHLDKTLLTPGSQGGKSLERRDRSPIIHMDSTGQDIRRKPWVEPTEDLVSQDGDRCNHQGYSDSKTHQMSEFSTQRLPGDRQSLHRTYDLSQSVDVDKVQTGGVPFHHSTPHGLLDQDQRVGSKADITGMSPAANLSGSKPMSPYRPCSSGSISSDSGMASFATGDYSMDYDYGSWASPAFVRHSSPRSEEQPQDENIYETIPDELVSNERYVGGVQRLSWPSPVGDHDSLWRRPQALSGISNQRRPSLDSNMTNNTYASIDVDLVANTDDDPPPPALPARNYKRQGSVVDGTRLAGHQAGSGLERRRGRERPPHLDDIVKASDILVDTPGNHMYTVNDVLQSFERLAGHLPHDEPQNAAHSETNHFNDMDTIPSPLPRPIQPSLRDLKTISLPVNGRAVEPLNTDTELLQSTDQNEEPWYLIPQPFPLRTDQVPPANTNFTGYEHQQSEWADHLDSIQKLRGTYC